jgi:sugar O-acyltransferase (sialic acid O-acetyltransferase NeuD family)
VIGAGGHARVLVEALRARDLNIDGFVTNCEEHGTGVMADLVRIGNDQDLMSWDRRDVALINGVGSIGRACARRAVFETFCAAGFAFASVIHPSAVIADDVTIGEGAQVMAGAILQCGVHVGTNAIINTGAIVDHDGRIGDHAHVAPGARLSADVAVSAGAHIGIGATVIQGRRIGYEAIVGAGAVVVDDVPDHTIAKGVPARAAQVQGG